MSDYTKELKHTIAQNFGSDAIWTGAVPVKEIFPGENVWEGEVQTFFLTDHPKAKQCFAWGVRRDDDQGWDVTAILGLPPVYSAQDAVKSTIVGHGR